ncbi:hypothetical protein P8R29_002242 [Escherichia coli]|nr:hypothetical protein [Escherichia coli]
MKRVLRGLRQRGRLRGGICSGDVRLGPLMVDGDTGNAGLVILHLLQSEEAITLTFLSGVLSLLARACNGLSSII